MKPRPTWRLTPTAEAHFWKALRETRQQWGPAQAETYRQRLLSGFQQIAEHHRSLRTAHREALAAGTAFHVHLIEHRYVVFQEYDEETVIVVGIFHERMDIPARIKELERLTKHELAVLTGEMEKGANEPEGAFEP